MIEQLARTSGQDLRDGTTTDVEAGLADLHARQARHQRRTKVGLVAAAVLAVGLSSIGGAVLTHRADQDISPTHPKPNQNHAAAFCPTIVQVTCLGHSTYRFPMARPLDWKTPPDLDPGTDVGPLAVQSDTNDGQYQGGVTVLERVRASVPNGKRAAAGVADTPRAFMQWVKNRPCLSAGPVRTTTLDGHPAWQVRVSLAPGVRPGPARCAPHNACYSIIHQPNGSQDGIIRNETSQYTALTLRGAGTTVVWSWIIHRNADLNTLEKDTHGLSWPTH